MKIANCPSCGAQVAFTSAASVMAVCPYCRATVLRDGATAENVGRLSEILDDFSPVQLGTQGKWQGKSFTVMGRLRLKYEDGAWNEWSIDFDDGSQGWLSDASGQYVVTRHRPSATTPPPYEQIRVGMRTKVAGRTYTVTDARTCVCVGGEGELPAQAFDGRAFPSVDLRSGKSFITFDYSDVPPSVYAGEASSREELEFSNLRTGEAIEAATGKLRGGVAGFDCPSCGASLEYHPGFGESIACSYCKALVALEGSRKTVILKQREIDARGPTLPLGARGTLRGKSYQVIGFMSRADEEGGEWEEYLLFDRDGGFQWLTYGDNEWYFGEVLNTLPEELSDGVYHDSKMFRLESEYSASTRYVLGEFNWRVKVGDSAQVTEWIHEGYLLSRELYQNEVTWTYSTRISSTALAKAFGLPLAPDDNERPTALPSIRNLPWDWVFAAWVVAFVVDIIAHLAGHGSFGAFLVAAVLLYVPKDLWDN
ncbi:MAG TPA: DUF4178 domain-containing protein [Gammaproteobacteria bacterium]